MSKKQVHESREDAQKTLEQEVAEINEMAAAEGVEMPEEIKPDPKAGWGEERWAQYLHTSMRKSAEQMLETGRRFHECREHTDRKYGKAKFSKIMKQLGVGKDAVTYWCKIGESFELLSTMVESLPTSRQSLYELTKVGDDELVSLFEANYISPELDRDTIKNYAKAAEKARSSSQFMADGEELHTTDIVGYLNSPFYEKDVLGKVSVEATDQDGAPVDGELLPPEDSDTSETEKAPKNKHLKEHKKKSQTPSDIYDLTQASEDWFNLTLHPCIVDQIIKLMINEFDPSNQFGETELIDKFNACADIVVKASSEVIDEE